MTSEGLGAAWAVLETEISGAPADAIQTVPTGLKVSAGAVSVGLDTLGRRHVVIPLLPGEAFAEDRSGRGVQLWRLSVDGQASASLVCLLPALNSVFERLAQEVLTDATSAPSPAKRATEVLATWKQLLAVAADSAVLSDAALAGLLGELLCLEDLVRQDPARRVECWVGADHNQHDFLCGGHALEVKATTAREGRIIQISSVDQLDPAPAHSLHLVVYRLQLAPDELGMTILDVIRRITELGANDGELHQRLARWGYSPVHDDVYRSKPFVIMERRVYDVSGPSFPRIIRPSFAHGDVPAGTLRLRYSIDLTNEPPSPLPERSAAALFEDLALR